MTEQVPNQMTLADALAEVNPGMGETAHATSSDWWSRAEQAVRAIARTGLPFQAYDLVEQFHLEEPGNGAKQWGSFLAAMRKAGVIEHAGFTTSRRPTANGSACRQWVGAASPIKEAA